MPAAPRRGNPPNRHANEKKTMKTAKRTKRTKTTTEKIPTLNAHQLRELADAASSMRQPGGEPFYVVVVDGNSADPHLEIKKGTGTQPADAVVEIDTFEVEARPVPTAVDISCDGQVQHLVTAYDAVFWSEAAVEKFLLPYYASKSLWLAAAVLDKISRYWYGGIPQESPARTGEVDIPFALAHTPDSEWSSLSPDGVAAGRDLHFLARGHHGVRVVPLADLSDPPAGWRRPGTAGPARRTRAASAGA
jgi:hypothetical protein